VFWQWRSSQVSNQTGDVTQTLYVIQALRKMTYNLGLGKQGYTFVLKMLNETRFD